MTVTPEAMRNTLSRLRGRFVVFEGPDGSGKSTQFKRLSELATSCNVPHTIVREPGGTKTGGGGDCTAG